LSTDTETLTGFGKKKYKRKGVTEGHIAIHVGEGLK
jgi:hypothetical protein